MAVKLPRNAVLGGRQQAAQDKTDPAPSPFPSSRAEKQRDAPAAVPDKAADQHRHRKPEPWS